MKKFFPVWVFPVFLFFAVGSIWVRLAIVRTTYSIHETDRLQRTLQQEKEKLELKVAQLRSPRRLEIIAREKFHLKPPRTDQVVWMSR